MNTLGIDKPPHATRVVVAMSGGVDSSVAAALLAEEGYDVVGVTLQLYDHGLALQKKGACCAGQDIYDARMVAERIGIPHYVLDYESRFRQDVIDQFADSYVQGQTPIPCILCNQTVKFRDLLAVAKDLGADALATGHYIQRRMGSQGPELHRGADPARDQSYLLFATTRDQLDFLRFPLGHMPKSETRDHARRFGLEVQDKPDSQDICFVPDGDYAGLVAKLRPGAIEPGEIRHLDGRVLGQHDGIIHYTIGQRRGLGVAEGEPLYVIRLDPARRQVIVGPRAALGRDLVTLRTVNWLGDAVGADGLRCHVRLRSAQAPMPATIILTADGGALLRLDTPAQGVAPGQAGVIYDGSRVLGGGWIASASLSTGPDQTADTAAA